MIIRLGINPLAMGALVQGRCGVLDNKGTPPLPARASHHVLAGAVKRATKSIISPGGVGAAAVDVQAPLWPRCRVYRRAAEAHGGGTDAASCQHRARVGTAVVRALSAARYFYTENT